jgi:uncharacterized protein (TIGR03437 family)
LILAIGMGPTDPVVATGAVSPASTLARVVTAVTVNLANEASAVFFAGLAPGKTGVYQMNVRMPDDVITADRPISLGIGGVSSNTLTLPTSDAPVVSGLQNAYSFISAGFPNYGIAQGAIFAIYGSNLASSKSAGQIQYPLAPALNEVSVNVIVNGTITHPFLYYVTPNQLGAVLPSNTPAGTGQITVTKNGQTGPVAPIQVVESAFGLLTLNQAGSGPAAALDVNFRFLGLTNAVRPGEYVNFWGSGVGPSIGNDALVQTQVDLGNISIEVNIGGVPATVTYHGRSSYPGLDRSR